MGIKTNKLLRNHSASNFINAVTDGTDTAYVFIGKETSWGAPDTPPAAVDDNNATLSEIKSDMLAVKKIPYTDMTYVVARHNWVNGTVYDEFRNDYSSTNLSASGSSTLDNATFYVINSTNKVYKCISNNSGVPSTVEPTSVSTGMFETADGYVWKYLYALSGAVMLKFADANWIPVTSDVGVVAAAVDGEISHVIVNDGGTGYPPSTTVPVYIEVDGDIASDATVAATVIGGTIISVTGLDNVIGGSIGNYTPSYTGMPVVFRQVTASGIVESATGLINTTATGKVGSVTLVSGGTGYTSGTVYIEQSKATGVATTNSSGTVTKVIIPNLLGGTNNTTGECRIVASQGSGFEGTVVIGPKGGHGSNPISELLCSTIGLSTKLSYPTDDPDVPPDLTFRTYGIVLNPNAYGTSTKFSSTTGNCLTKIRLTGLSGGTTFSDSDLVYGGTSGATAKVVSVINAGQYTLSVVYTNNYKFISGENVYLDATHYGTIDLITLPEVDKRSGDIVFFDYTAPVNRSTVQTETIQVFFNF